MSRESCTCLRRSQATQTPIRNVLKQSASFDKCLLVHVQGWTPLHCAAQFNRADIAHRLILAGSDVCATDKQVSAQPTRMP